MICPTCLPLPVKDGLTCGLASSPQVIWSVILISCHEEVEPVKMPTSEGARERGNPFAERCTWEPWEWEILLPNFSFCLCNNFSSDRSESSSTTQFWLQQSFYARFQVQCQKPCSVESLVVGLLGALQEICVGYRSVSLFLNKCGLKFLSKEDLEFPQIHLLANFLIPLFNVSWTSQ